MLNDDLYNAAKGFFIMTGATLSVLYSSFPFVLICFLVTAFDCYSAFALSRRVRKKYPEANDGKFKSKYAKKIFGDLLEVSALIVLAALIDRYIIPGEYVVFLPNIVAGMFCFAQVWSALENSSSENDSKWAKLLQRIMVNKAERHFDVPLRDLLSDDDKPKDAEEKK
jgi:hypothetical protein